jgi:hypothetical protein
VSSATVHDAVSTAKVMRFEPHNSQRSRVCDQDKEEKYLLILQLCFKRAIKNFVFLTQKQMIIQQFITFINVITLFF